LFLTYILDVPSSHPFVAKRFFWTAPKELFLAMPWTLGVVGVLTFLNRRVIHKGNRFWMAQGLMGLFLSALMRGHHGGFTNVLIPGLWFMALWSGLIISHLRQRWAGLPIRATTAALVAWQLWAGQWSPETYVPTEADKSAGDRVVDQLGQIDGPILAPWQPWMPVQAGNRPSIALIALWDIDHEGGPLYEEAQVISESIANKHWAAILTARSKLKRGLKTHYKKVDFDRPMGRALYPKTGWKVRPHALWEPKPN
jgi:hypothetical protein